MIGHEDTIAMLGRSADAGAVAHAYLFVGAEGIGKATLARWLAQRLNCREVPSPCGVCTVCRRIERGTHSDVETVRPGGICDESEHDHSQDAGRDIRICQVRRAERVLGLAAFEGGRRVLILDPAEAMNAQSADAFLKTLEEPPRGAVLILVTANEGALSDTIRSRCRRVALRPLPIPVTMRVLREQCGATDEQAAMLTRLYGGQIGKAVAALADPDFVSRRSAMLDAAAALVTAPLAARFQIAENLATAYAKRDAPKLDTDGRPIPVLPPADGKPKGRPDVFATLDLWIEWWRDLLLTAAGNAAAVSNPARMPELERQAARLEPAQAAAGVRALRDARRDLEHNVNPRLALETLMLRLPAVA